MILSVVLPVYCILLLHKYGRNTQSSLEMVERIPIPVLKSWENSSYPRPYYKKQEEEYIVYIEVREAIYINPRKTKRTENKTQE